MTGPANGVRDVVAGAVDQKRGEKQCIPRTHFDGVKIVLAGSRDVAIPGVRFGFAQARAMAAGDDLQRAERSINVQERHPDDHGIERALHAPPILVRRRAIKLVGFGQCAGMKRKDRPRADGRRFDA